MPQHRKTVTYLNRLRWDVEECRKQLIDTAQHLDALVSELEGIPVHSMAHENDELVNELGVEAAADIQDANKQLKAFKKAVQTYREFF